MDDANLVLGLDKPDMGHVLQYTCPTCSSTRTEHIDERAIRLLMAAGIGLVGSPAGSRAASDGSSSRSSG